MQIKIAVLLVGLTLLLALFGPAVPAAQAADFRSGQTVVIAADEVIDLEEGAEIGRAVGIA